MVASCPELLDQARGPRNAERWQQGLRTSPENASRQAGRGGAWRLPSISGDTAQDAGCSRDTPGPEGRRPAGRPGSWSESVKLRGPAEVALSWDGNSFQVGDRTRWKPRSGGDWTGPGLRRRPHLPPAPLS